MSEPSPSALPLPVSPDAQEAVTKKVIDSLGRDRVADMTNKDAVMWLELLELDGYRTDIKAAVAHAINVLSAPSGSSRQPSSPEQYNAGYLAALEFVHDRYEFGPERTMEEFDLWLHARILEARNGSGSAGAGPTAVADAATPMVGQPSSTRTATQQVGWMDNEGPVLVPPGRPHVEHNDQSSTRGEEEDLSRVDGLKVTPQPRATAPTNGLEFNINWCVRVRLNDKGRAMLAHALDDVNAWLQAHGAAPLPPRELREDTEGWAKFQLWDLMNVFGSAMRLWSEPPFDTTIVLLRESHQIVDAVARGPRDGQSRPRALPSDALAVPSTPSSPAEAGLRAWDPIETAPKDGTPFIGWYSMWSLPSICLWLTPMTASGEGGWYRFEARPVLRHQLTHWMPLPEAPRSTAADAETAAPQGRTEAQV